jgi:hypothetical protein
VRKIRSGYEAVFGGWTVLRHLQIVSEEVEPDRLQILLTYKGQKTEWAAARALVALK